MLEIRYDKTTRKITGWWGDRHGNEEVKLKNRPDEAIALLNIPLPDKSLDAWLFDTDKLIPNPAYVEPLPPRDLLAELIANKAEINELKARLNKAGVI